MLKKIQVIAFLVLALLVTHSLAGQNSIRNKKLERSAKDYVSKQVGKNFLKENLRFLSIYQHGLTVAAFETIPGANSDGRNTVLVYFLDQSKEIDTSRSKLSKDEILSSIIGSYGSSLLIGKDKAIEIAKTAGLQPGIKPWRVSLIGLGKNQHPRWIVDATYNESTTGGDKASGETVSVDLINSTYELSAWNLIE